jgi:hypothetical protein
MVKRGGPRYCAVPQNFHVAQGASKVAGSCISYLCENNEIIFVLVKVRGQIRGVAFGAAVLGMFVDHAPSSRLEMITSRSRRSSLVASSTMAGSRSKPELAARAS